jgi:hypothetical protein
MIACVRRGSNDSRLGGGGFRSPISGPRLTPIGTRARAVGLLIALIAFVPVAMVAQVGAPGYFGTHLGLDNGIGG